MESTYGAPPEDFWDQLDHGYLEPVVKIQQVGRWRYHIYIAHGLMQYGPGGYGWHVYGLERAQRKGRRELRRYRRREERLGRVIELHE